MMTTTCWICALDPVAAGVALVLQPELHPSSSVASSESETEVAKRNTNKAPGTEAAEKVRRFPGEPNSTIGVSALSGET
jgi:hypothetical protein